LGYFFDTNYLDYEGSQDRTAKERRAISGKFVYDVDADTSFSTRLEYLETGQESPGSLTQAQFDADWQQAPITDAFTDQQMATATFSFTTALGPKSEIDLKYSIRRHEEQGMPSWNATSDYGEDDMLNHNLVAIYHHDFDLLDSRIIAGIDLQRAEVEEMGHTARSTSSPVDLTSSWDILARVTSPFLQYEFSPFERTRVTLGVRRDKVSYGAERKDGVIDEEKVFTSTSPKAGITFDLDDNNSLWFGYSEGFVVPSRSALYTSGWHIPDSNLKAEEADNFELGVRGQLMNGRFKYDVALYDTTIENMVVTEDIPGPRDRYVNAGEVEVKGLETSLSYKFIEQLRFDAAYTYAKNTYLDYVTSGDDYSGETMSSSPLHHMNFRTTWMPRHDLDVELEWDHLSAYHTHSDNSADPRGKYNRPDLFHLRVTYDIGSWSIWGHVLNLTDRKYGQRVSYDDGDATRKFTAGSERTFYTGVSYNW
jgi:outer membrane receptor protein involved in Fe transport